MLTIALCCLVSFAPLTFAGEEPEEKGVVRVVHLLDAMDAVEIKAGKHAQPSFSRYFQPFKYSPATEENQQFHRRVILHHKKEAVRDMREALVLPIPASASFGIEAAAGRTLSFTHLAFQSRTSPKELTLAVTCTGPDENKVVWTHTAGTRGLTKFQDWPARVEIPLPEWCTRISYETSTTDRGKGLFGVWGNPLIEQPVAVPDKLDYNVLYIVVDALRSDAVGVHRTDFPSVSPAIDKLEASGTTFPRGFSNGNTTLLSMNTMLLGTHPRAMGFLTLWWAGQDRREQFYERDPPYLTRLLSKAGYVTYGATHNHLYFPGYKFGVDPGFDVLQDSGRDTEDHPILTRRAIEFMRLNRSRRFLVQVNLIAPHQPYSPPAECLEQVEEALGRQKLMIDRRYLGEVCWADKHVGRLMDTLDELGLREDTLVLLTADHGEVMDYAHDCPKNRDGHRCRHLHGLTLYDEEINIPIMFSLPGVVKARVSRTVAQHVDIVPTVMELFGLQKDERMTGRSLVPALVKGEEQEDVPVIAERWLARTIRMGSFKLIHHTRKDDICPKAAQKVCKSKSWVELYNIDEDPCERREISRKHPDKVEELEARLEEIRAWMYEKSGSEGPNP